MTTPQPDHRKYTDAFKIDMHVHTLHSGDSEANPEDMVQAAITRGLHGIAFTEHYSYEASGYATALAEKYSGKIIILRGVEISADEGHLLVYGVNTDNLLPIGAPSVEIIETVTKRGGVVIPSHPFRRGSSIGDMARRLKGLTALEGYNGCNLHSMNEMAVALAANLGLPFTGGSDAHAPSEIGSCYTEFYTEVTQDNFIETLKNGHYRGFDSRKISRQTLPLI